MKQSAVALILLLAVPASALLSAKGTTVRIAVNGGVLLTPIEINRPEVVEQFNIWAGPGTRSGLRDPITGQWRMVEGTEGFIVEWRAGEIAALPSGLERYEVSFFVRQEDSAEQLAYVVLYANDSAHNEGYVLLPGPEDARYRLNTRAIRRGVEGKWFRASSAWQAVVAPLIAARHRR
jgi:hypothetical protein